ncbi:GDNF family receptor alpha-like [Kryptolebias marmoratus]|uniref:GDNF family receptor alpha-like n=1 Tax=Kryptolebias marmoratus TaxID=37003 RepID=UPI000D531174|nr:GDNF family receptor alpha-like [Kryptolebias marmoratus]
MQLVHQEAAVIFGFVFLQISSISISSPTSDCLALVETCMSDLCRHEQTVLTGSCEDEACQIKGSEVCNLTFHTALDQFPSLRGCVCSWEEELCDSVQELAKQCSGKPVIHQKGSTDWKSSSFIENVHDGSGSCVDRFAACVSDLICNRHLTPVLRACTVELCDNDRCQREIQQLYGNMPQKTAEMLVMCECEGSDPNCLLMKTGLQSGTCGVETLVCQERLDQCVQDRTCRHLLKTFQDKCWNLEETQCSDRNLQVDECFTLMNPAHILGADSECKKAFLNTLGTVLHQPCTCKGVHDDYLLMCTRIHDVFHNRRHFMSLGENVVVSSKPPESNESEDDPTWSFDNLLYVLAALLLAGILILLLLVVVSKIWLKRSCKIKLGHSRKRNFVIL